MLHDLAPAKINLFLHVLGRRDDGYHLLESLVGFADIGDALTLEPGPPLSLAVSGPFAAGLSGDDNLILRAARGFVASYPGRAAGRFGLEKNLPVASGIGGGSTDAAAALRLLARAAGIPLDDPPLLAVARALGADVPVCLEARPRLMRGIGHDLGPALRAGAIPAVLVNPGVAVPTPAVFAALGLAPGARHAPPPVRTVFTEDAVAELAATTRNDLEGPALTLAPAIGDALAALRAASGCRLARMSGSGATVFGLFADAGAAEAALAAIRARHPDWWVRPCRITLPLGAGTRLAGMEVSV